MGVPGVTMVVMALPLMAVVVMAVVVLVAMVIVRHGAVCRMQPGAFHPFDVGPRHLRWSA